jgi:hypothetical protein
MPVRATLINDRYPFMPVKVNHAPAVDGHVIGLPARAFTTKDGKDIPGRYRQVHGDISQDMNHMMVEDVVLVDPGS